MAKSRASYLSIDEELPVQFLFTSARVPGEKHTGAWGVSHVSKHHTLNIHGGPLQPCDPIYAPVLDGSGAVPWVKHGQDRQVQLLPRICKPTTIHYANITNSSKSQADTSHVLIHDANE